jgi:hypothetical protein
MAIPRPASDRIDIEWAIIWGISKSHLLYCKCFQVMQQDKSSKQKKNYGLYSLAPYLNETRDHVSPIRLE